MIPTIETKGKLSTHLSDRIGAPDFAFDDAFSDP